MGLSCVHVLRPTLCNYVPDFCSGRNWPGPASRKAGCIIGLRLLFPAGVGGRCPHPFSRLQGGLLELGQGCVGPPGCSLLGQGPWAPSEQSSTCDLAGR